MRNVNPNIAAKLPDTAAVDDAEHCAVAPPLLPAQSQVQGSTGNG